MYQWQGLPAAHDVAESILLAQQEIVKRQQRSTPTTH